MSVVYNSCTGCYPKLSDMLMLCKGSKGSLSNELIQFLKQHGCLSDQVKCSRCNTVRQLNMNLKSFKCSKNITVNKSKKLCAYSESVFAGTFFANAKLDISVIFNFIIEFLTKNAPISQYLTNELGLGQGSICDWIYRAREVLVYWTEKHFGDKLGGPGTTVELNIHKLGKTKSVEKDMTGFYVLGGIEVDSNRIFIVPIESIESSNIQTIITNHIEPGTTVVTDCWQSSDRGLHSEALHDLEENHSITFVSPDNGDLSDKMKQMWQKMEDIVPKYGRKKENLPGYVAEFMFKHKYPNHRDRFHHFFKALTELYSPAYFYRCC